MLHKYVVYITGINIKHTEDILGIEIFFCLMKL